MTPRGTESHGTESHGQGDSVGAAGHIEEWEHLALDLLEGTLPPVTRAALYSHIDRCPRCRELLDEQQQVSSLLSAVPLMEPPTRIEHNVLGADRPGSAARGLEDRARASRRRSIMRTWLPAAAVLVMTVVAVATYQQAFPRGGEADLAIKGQTTAAEESQDSGAAMSTAPADETTATTSAASEAAVTEQPTTTNLAPTADQRLSVSAYLDALPPGSGHDVPVVLLTMPASDLDSVVASKVGAVTGLSPLQAVDSSDTLVTFAARVARTEIDALVARLGEPGLGVFRFVDRTSELPPGVGAVVGDDPSAFPLIAATPGEGGGFALLDAGSNLRALDDEGYVLVVITSSGGQ